MYKKIIFFTLIVLVYVLSFNVFAIDYQIQDLPTITIIDDYKYIIVGTTDLYDEYIGQFTHIALISKEPLERVDTSTWFTTDGVAIRLLYDNVWYQGPTKGFDSVGEIRDTGYNLIEPIYSNYDVYYYDSTDVFFSRPFLAAQVATELPQMIQLQIVPIIGVGILLISLMLLLILLRKLFSYF